MICLGIESTAHTFSVGIVEDKKILTHERSVYQPPKGEGLHPNKVKKHHLANKETVLEKALEKSGLELKDIELFAYSKGPGLPPALKVGSDFIGSIAGEKPVIGVNHCISHIEIGRLLTKAKDPITLYVSGGNTQVIGHAGGKYRVFGETLDKPIGASIDTFIRKTHGGSPGGPIMEKLAKEGNYIKLPYVVKGMDLSFSGILTKALQLAKKEKLEDLCYSFQETCYAMLTEITERALAHTGKEEVLLTGGVAASQRLQKMLKTMCEERGAEFFVCPREYAGDNGAMIAWTGILAKKQGKPFEKKPDFIQKWRTDDVGWRL